MTESVRFYFDPTCPWAWQTAKWIREVEGVRDIGVQWRLFSLRLVNESPDDPLTDTSARSVPALRALALIGREHGNEAVGRPSPTGRHSLSFSSRVSARFIGFSDCFLCVFRAIEGE